jgi:hypothetical protein
MSWSEALDAQLALRGWLATLRGRLWGDVLLDRDVSPRPRPERFVEGDAIWVSGEISAIAIQALAEWQPEPLLLSDLLVPVGFMLLEAPIRVPGLAAEGVDLDREELLRIFAEESAELAEATHRPLRAFAWVVHGERVWIEVFTDRAKGGTGPPGINHFGGPMPLPEDEDDIVRQYLQILWRLAQQRITMHERQPADRAARRRAARAGCDDPYVTVITLRHTQRPRDGEPSAVDWAHRWIVGGHWRNQWYPSIEAHRQIWIAPHVKGPEDKDLRIRDARAISFVR